MYIIYKNNRKVSESQDEYFAFEDFEDIKRDASVGDIIEIRQVIEQVLDHYVKLPDNEDNSIMAGIR
jgi:hypothetical protein